MEEDCNEEDDEAVNGDGDGHSDEDGVEKNTAFDKGDLKGLNGRWIVSRICLVDMRWEKGHLRGSLPSF